MSGDSLAVQTLVDVFAGSLSRDVVKTGESLLAQYEPSSVSQGLGTRTEHASIDEFVEIGDELRRE